MSFFCRFQVLSFYFLKLTKIGSNGVCSFVLNVGHISRRRVKHDVFFGDSWIDWSSTRTCVSAHLSMSVYGDTSASLRLLMVLDLNRKWWHTLYFFLWRWVHRHVRPLEDCRLMMSAPHRGFTVTPSTGQWRADTWTNDAFRCCEWSWQDVSLTSLWTKRVRASLLHFCCTEEEQMMKWKFQWILQLFLNPQRRHSGHVTAGKKRSRRQNMFEFYTLFLFHQFWFISQTERSHSWLNVSSCDVLLLSVHGCISVKLSVYKTGWMFTLKKVKFWNWMK